MINSDWELKNPGLVTELMVHRFESRIETTPEYRIVTTPSNPRFSCGNYLIFKQPPPSGCVDLWEALFESAVGSVERSPHRYFTWDGVDGDEGAAVEFVQRGYSLERCEVMFVSEPVKPLHWNPDVRVRRAVTSADWENLLEVAIHAEDPQHCNHDLRGFFKWLLGWMRREAEAGHGGWYIGSLRGRDLAVLGLFHDGRTGRFQEVITVTEARGQGLCTTLVYESACDALHRYGLEKLCIVPDEGETASRIYRAIGFSSVGKLRGLYQSLKP